MYHSGKFTSIIVGKGDYTPPPPFLRFPTSLEIHHVPTFHRFIGKTKVLDNSCNNFIYNFYPQSILVFDFWKNVYKSGEIQT